MQNTKSKTKKRLFAVAAVLMAAIMLTGGTYAWFDYTQHKSNEGEGTVTYDVTLMEDFDPKDTEDWKVEDGEITKKVWVMSNEGADFETFVRLQLKEYMEISPIFYTRSDEYYMLADDGSFTVYSTETAAKKAYPDHVVAEMHDIVTGQKGWFIQTQAGDQNGQYGKKVTTDIYYGEAESMVDGVTRSPDVATEAHHVKPNGECDYTIHTWSNVADHKDCEYGFHKYVEWIMGSEVISYSDWMDTDRSPIAKWIYDDRDINNPYVYWGEALQPGASTSNLMEAMKLIKQPEGKFYYALHVDMEAVSLSDLGKWDGTAPEEILDTFDPEGERGDTDAANKNALKKAIDKATGLNPDDYTNYAEVADEIAAALANGNTVYADKAALQPAVDAATKALNDAMDKLIAKTTDKSGLEDAINEADALDPTDYPNWDTTIKDVLEDAKEVYDSPSSTQEEIDQAEEDLRDALDNLVAKANDKSGLKDAIDTAEALTPSDYTNWDTAVKDVLAEANKVYADENATQPEVDKAEQDLRDALTKLVENSELKLKEPYATKPEWTPTSEDHLDKILMLFGDETTPAADRVFEIDHAIAASQGVSPYIEIPLADLLADTKNVKLTVKAGQRFTSSDVWIENGYIYSACIPTYNEIHSSPNWAEDCVVPVVVILEQGGKTVEFTINNMYFGPFAESWF